MKRGPADSNGKIPRKKWRILIIQFGGILVFGMVLWRVHDVQHVYGKILKHDEQRTIDVKHTALAVRGAIEDSTGNKLAYDMPAYYLDIELVNLKPYKAKVANVIAPILGTSTGQVTSILSGTGHWFRWKTILTDSMKAKLETAFAKHIWAPKKTGVNWQNDITFTPTEKRVYPDGTVAANVLGYVATNGKPVGGIEQELNQSLSGTDGLLQYKQDAYGFPMPGTVTVLKKAVPGDNVQLTLNSDIQGYVHNEMKALVKKYQPHHAAIVVTNPTTGAILAMSSSPTFNPNTYWTASPTARSQNWAISASFEPGSTFKPFVLAAALATNSVRLNQTYMSGHTTVDGRRINDWKPQGWGTLTYQQALEVSSNVGFVHIASALGWPNLTRYMNLFGFTKKTGIGLPGEGGPQLFPASQRHQIELATAGFGQGIAVTPIQQVQAMGAIANGGKLMKPYLVKQITSPTGKVVKQFQPTTVRQNFMSQSALDAVRHTMVLDVSGKKGIDTVARIQGYQVAGKTGTAQIVNPKTGQYYNNRYNTSFMGFAPADNPKVEVFVTVNDPNTPVSNTWGSTVAGPFAQKILSYCLEYYHVSPTGTVATAKNTSTHSASGATHYVNSPNIVGMTAASAKKKLAALGFQTMLVGGSGTITKQFPAAGIQLVKGSKIYAVTNVVAQHAGKVQVPNLSKLSLRDAMNLIGILSLKLKPSGDGYIVQQSIAAGTMVKPGTTVSVTLKP